MTRTRTASPLLLALAMALAIAASLLPTSASAAEVNLATFRNAVGICHHPLHQCNFDGGGFSYSMAALALADVLPGDPVEADGFTFTWPDTDAGEPDNVEMNGQIIPLLPGDATRIGFLGASHHGPATVDVILHYTDVDEEGELVEVAVPTPLALSDWTLNANTRGPEPGNTTAITTRFRVNGTTVEQVPTHVFVTDIDIDTTMSLQSIELPADGRFHIFGLALA